MSAKHTQFCQIWSNVKMSNNPAKSEVLIKQYLRLILDISGSCSPIIENFACLVSGFEMDLIRILEKMSSNKALKYLNLGQNMRQRYVYWTQIQCTWSMLVSYYWTRPHCELEKSENSVFTLKRIKRFPSTLRAGEIQKLLLSPWKHFAEGIKNPKNHQSCVLGKHGQRNHVIIVTSSFWKAPCTVTVQGHPTRI